MDSKEHPTKRPTQQIQESIQNKKSKKARKTEKTNPFEQLYLIEKQQRLEQQKKNAKQNGWVKVKTTPLTIQICDHSKVNKFYSHKSLQKYIRYLYAQTCPNPMWLSIKRQSQIKKIVYIDFECQNSLIHKNLQKQQQQSCFQFLRQFVCPAKKAIFKQSAFLRDSNQLWQAMFVYDELAVKEEMHSNIDNDQMILSKLPKQLTLEMYMKYRTYMLNQQQQKANLYPVKNLPAYQGYYKIQKPKQQQQEQQQDQNKEKLNNKILIIDCEMVMSTNGFELARASIINFSGELVYDQFFKPDAQIVNYNTKFSGITAETLQGVTKRIDDLHKDLSKIIKHDTILVGHSLENDFHAMKFMHPNVIDTSVLFSRKNGAKMKLRTLAQQILNRTIQSGSHCSEQDCKATLDIMRFKIEIQEAQKQNQNIKYHLLTELQEASKNTIILDSDLQFIRHKAEFMKTKFCVIPNNLPKTVLPPLKAICKQQENEQKIDIAFTRVRRGEHKIEWESYYRDFDQNLRQLYNQIPIQSVILVNCQINHSHIIYPQDPTTEQERKRTFCIILVKSTI